MPQSKHNYKILFAGDPHGDFNPVIAAVKAYKPEAVVLLGDYDLEMPLEDYLQDIIDQTEIWWIAGNHDFQSPSKHHNLFQSGLADNGLHLKVTEIAGFKIAGLSGIFLGRVWYPPSAPIWKDKQHFLMSHKNTNRDGSMSLKYQSAIWHDEFETLKKLKADILVSHEAPGSHRFGFTAISDLAVAMGVKNIFHGHLHETYSAVTKNNINVFGVADKSVSDLAGNTLQGDS
ncbi:MAG: metallophosphoesterase [Methylococcaceae bacterium]|nr:metallophosphoesterase [Methylococcaceae bacterium]